jgi:hypothetical protein
MTFLFDFIINYLNRAIAKTPVREGIIRPIGSGVVKASAARVLEHASNVVIGRRHVKRRSRLVMDNPGQSLFDPPTRRYDFGLLIHQEFSHFFYAIDPSVTVAWPSFKSSVKHVMLISL